MAIPPPPDDPRKLGSAIPPPPSDPKMLGGAPGPRPSMLERGWEALAVPAEKSQEGLDTIARGIQRYFPGREPTGNMLLDVGLNTPKATAEAIAETAAKVAPTFIDRTTLATAGALKASQALAPIGRGVARIAEGFSGLEHKTPGVLVDAANDASLMFGPGKAKASAIYKRLVNRAGVSKEIGEELGHSDVVANAKKAIEAGTLNADEALIARKSLDKMIRSGAASKDNALALRESLDAVAKQKFAVADAAHARAIKSEALRQPLAVNKTGGTSIAKNIIGGVMLPVAGTFGMSPAVQGAVATGVGAAARSPVPIGLAAGAVSRRLRGENK